MRALLLAAVACSSAASPATRDAAVPDAASVPDAPAVPDAAPAGVFADFTATGCDAVPSGDEPCRGTAPLTLTFLPIVPPSVQTLAWDFGDGATSGDTLARHVYEHPGRYDVTLAVSGAEGSDVLRRDGFVVVAPAPIGARCVEADQCEAGRCICTVSDGCDAPLDDGLCTAACTAGCPGDGVCVDLGAGPEAWRGPLCLERCDGDACARPGFDCLMLPSTDGWAAACFPPLVSSVGGPCRGVDGAPDGALCAGGLCLDLGERGLCSADCTTRPCPAGSACADIAGGPARVCLAACGQGAPCAGDAWLGCEMPGGAFTVDGPAAPGGYCAPKACGADADCGLRGRCAGGRCGP